jgi:hypothetical protein
MYKFLDEIRVKPNLPDTKIFEVKIYSRSETNIFGNK